MKVIRPLVIDSTNLVSSTAPETDLPTWAEGTSYALNARVLAAGMIYESVQAPNVGHAPASSALYWTVISASNHFLMFDAEVGSATAATGNLTVVVAPGALFDSIALLDLVATTVVITVRDGAGGPVIYDYTASLDGSIVSDWYQYFYQPFVPIRQVVLTNLPMYGSAHITVTLSGTGGIQCGSMVLGSSFFLGDTQFGGSSGIIDLSKKETTASGTRLVKGKFSKRMSLQLVVQRYNADNVSRVLAELRATAAVYVGTDVAGYERLTNIGFFRDFSEEISYPTQSLYSIEIESLSQG